ncbi:hypothetical protein BC829DRAFT_418383 [Chytridium lagenaria]|nr:hypothetical protein BC829DRAFT_418383 [Chytridium lagenaria]
MQLATKTEKTVKTQRTYFSPPSFLRARRKFSEKSVDEAVKTVETGRRDFGGLVEEPKGMEETEKDLDVVEDEIGTLESFVAEKEVMDKKVVAVEMTAAVKEGLKETWVVEKEVVEEEVNVTDVKEQKVKETVTVASTIIPPPEPSQVALMVEKEVLEKTNVEGVKETVAGQGKLNPEEIVVTKDEAMRNSADVLFLFTPNTSAPPSLTSVGKNLYPNPNSTTATDTDTLSTSPLTTEDDILTDDEDALITLDDLREYISDDEDAGVRGVVSVVRVEMGIVEVTGCRRGRGCWKGVKGVLERCDGEEGGEAVVPPVQDDEYVNEEDISITLCAELKLEEAVDVKEIAIPKAAKVMEVGAAVDTTIPSVQGASNFDKETPTVLCAESKKETGVEKVVSNPSTKIIPSLSTTDSFITDPVSVFRDTKHTGEHDADLLENVALEAPIKAEMERSIHVTNESGIMDDTSNFGFRGGKVSDVSDAVAFVEATEIEKDVAEFVANEVEILPAEEAKGRACESAVTVAVETADVEKNEDIGELVTDKVQTPMAEEVCDVLDFAVGVEPTDVVGLTTDEAQMFPVREVEVNAREVLDAESSAAPTDVVKNVVDLATEQVPVLMGNVDVNARDVLNIAVAVDPTDVSKDVLEKLDVTVREDVAVAVELTDVEKDVVELAIAEEVELKAREDLDVAVVVESNDVVKDCVNLVTNEIQMHLMEEMEVKCEGVDSDVNIQMTVKDEREGEAEVDGAVAILPVSSVNMEVSAASLPEKPTNAPKTPTPIIQTFPFTPSPTSPSRPLNLLPSHTRLHHVRNLSFHKTITVLYSTDNWVTSAFTQPAVYVCARADGWDCFEVEWEVGDGVEFAVKCVMGEGEWWDNNGGRNYRIYW